MKDSTFLDDNEENQAKFYDRMIPWEKRLQRELPLLQESLEGTWILDLACSSGRHSFALESIGFSTVGVDISDDMIQLAKELAIEKKSGSKFVSESIADIKLYQKIAEVGPSYYDSAILLGNAIANLGSLDAGLQMLRSVFIMLKPGGRFFLQTVNRPLRPHYNPLRAHGDEIIQRIMVPVEGEEYNVLLHVNRIHKVDLVYTNQKHDNEFYMYRTDEFSEIIKQIGFELHHVWGGYDKSPVSNVDGEGTVWLLRKPEITLDERSLELFNRYNGFQAEQIIERTLKIWQDVMSRQWYHCTRGYRFLFPRITSHPRYADVLQLGKGMQLLDMGCFMGTDLRQLSIDGEFQSLTGMDREGIFWESGLELFDDAERIEIEFIESDVLSFNMMDRFDIIHAGSLLHLLTETENESLIHAVFDGLRSGGVFFGRCVGNETGREDRSGLRYLHSIETLTRLLERSGFVEISVNVMDAAPIGERSMGENTSLGFYAVKS
ncbi:MAG: class I SAM-dependent methyltransferase [Candidatus Heimdallarchaeota archaeon]|nr:class I SAM-dependent methyltransferase [Candidatus Heimdallarchaeota archaeon]